jgi:beta-glucanase (GH16 family)
MKTINNLLNGQSFLVQAFILIGCLFLISCEKKSGQTLPKRNWELTWSDDFNDSLGKSPDSTRWTYDIGTGSNGWGNAELQYYTDRPSNVQMDGVGNLVITARKEDFVRKEYTSSRIKTKGLFDQKYGRFEARLKTPTGQGFWSAFWMMGSNIDEVSWPQCGEIDIMEQRGQQPAINHGSLHGPGYSGGNSKTKAYTLEKGRFDTEYHVYAVEWGDGFIEYFIDDFLYQRITPADVKGSWVFNQNFFMILNIAVGGNFLGPPTPSTQFPQSMYVDYVKVYKQKS